MIDRPIYDNSAVNRPIGLTRDKVITALTEQKDKQYGLFASIQAVALIAISCLAFAIVSYVSSAHFEAVVLSVAGFVIGGGAAYLFYNKFFLLEKVLSDLRQKYEHDGEIAFSELQKIIAVCDEPIQEKLVKQMSFEEAVMARRYIRPDKFKSWVSGTDFSAVFDYTHLSIEELKPIVDKNYWVLRALEPVLSPEAVQKIAARNLVGNPLGVFGIMSYVKDAGHEEQINDAFDLPLELKEIMKGNYVDLNQEKLFYLLETAEKLSSGELFRFIDEHIHTHIDEFDQNDLIEIIEKHPSLIKTRSYLARQIKSRNITSENFRELWMLAVRVDKKNLREKFSKFVRDQRISDFDLVKDILSKEELKDWFREFVNRENMIQYFITELSSLSSSYEWIYSFKPEAYWRENKDSIEINKDNYSRLIKLPAFKDDVEKYIQNEWQELLIQKKISIENLLENPSIKGAVLDYLKKNHDDLIEKKILTSLAWKDYEEIYFS